MEEVLRRRGKRQGLINCETKVKVMDKVNCELYRFTVKLKQRA
jgi:hypothetical protein